MNKFLKSGLTTAVIAGTLFSGFPGNYFNTAGTSPLHKVQAQANVSQSYGSLDLSIVNDEKLLESLIKRGVIPAGASAAEKQKALNNYLEVKGKDDKAKQSDPLAAKVKAADAEKQRKFKDFNHGLLKGQGNKYGQLKGNPDPVQEGASPGVKKKGKLLTLTVEFSDLPHNQIQPDETDNYYKDYNLQHYEDMIFGEKGVQGPNGEDFVSQKQFYEQQSGGTYTVEGKAYGWLKVPGTAAFYGADAKGGHDNVGPGGSKQLVKDTLEAAKAAGIPLQDYDLEDPHDLNGNGNLWEPDGLVDHLQIIHSGMGQEAGGGKQGDNAIWSHRSAVFYDPDGLGKGLPGFYDYTMMPEDGATGVFAHEYGHDLGLPDEYDTQYTGTGEAIGYWSIMASGSWAGKVPGAEPTGFSPFAKSYFASTLGGEWAKPTAVNWEDVSTKGTQFLLDQGNSPLGKNGQTVQINLPQKKTHVLDPLTGSYSFWGGNGDEINNTMVTNVDLTGKTTASLTFDAWYKIEESWDFAFVQVSEDGGKTWKSLSNADTRSDVVNGVYPTIPDNLPGFTGDSKGWKKETFDLSAYTGKKIQVQFRYITDWGYSDTGLFVDNVRVTADGTDILTDGAENASSAFTMKGFDRFDGNVYANQYYLLEWRNHKGVDEGLAHIKRGNSLMSYDGGLVVWYVDESYTDNFTGTHPGDGWLGVVDAHQGNDLLWQLATGKTAEASTRYHIADAAFGLNPTSGLNIDYPGVQTLTSPSLPAISLFNDSNSFANTFMPDAGRNLGKYGLKVRVNGQSTDKSVGSIVIYK
ncbi:immune inhibitor A domain-containing protein [Neobacillus terrae]|uniref:immune inhibitor A domain-containing protein n=1 Tax=Neobacillus terrae TaxID=3034837 RepID=UPI00140C1F4C|nr:immune inhibitor A domain-containing protein [Neobacillus terrae]NHM31878.1 M6 family metalloprotease domain-containing protein [Neobacillus terrae]